MDFTVSADIRGRIALPVDGRTKRTQRLTAKRDQIEFTLALEQRPERVVLTARATLGQVDCTTKEGMDEAFAKARRALADLKEHIQAIESVFAYLTNPGTVERILWESPEVHLLHSTPEEYACLPYVSRHGSPERPREPQMISEEEFREAIVLAKHCGALVIPLAFCREGSLHYERWELRQAFYQFYFVLEALFADGQFKTAQVRRSFQNSSEFMSACTAFTEKFLAGRHKPGTPMAEYDEEMRRALADGGCATDPGGVRDYIVAMRGRLHHYSGSSRGQHATPLNQNDFWAATWAVRWVALDVINTRVDDARTAAGLPRKWDQYRSNGRSSS